MAFEEGKLYKIGTLPFAYYAVRNEERRQWEFILDPLTMRFVVKDSAPTQEVTRDRSTTILATAILPF